MNRFRVLSMATALVLAGFVGTQAGITRPSETDGCVCCGDTCACAPCVCDSAKPADCACCGDSACCSPRSAPTPASCCKAPRTVKPRQVKPNCSACGTDCGCGVCGCETSAKPVV